MDIRQLIELKDEFKCNTSNRSRANSTKRLFMLLPNNSINNNIKPELAMRMHRLILFCQILNSSRTFAEHCLRCRYMLMRLFTYCSILQPFH